jgi:glycosyltransferase involved in cell wall biosynthesis
MNGRSAIWITWEYQTRNRSLSSLLDIPLYEIVSERKGLQRYGESLLKTLRLIRAEKPDVLFCQNPSIVLSFFCVILQRLLSCKVIVDQHNAGLFPLDGQNRLLNWIARYIVRNANAVIVTNRSLAKQCTRWGGNPIVIEDPLPDFTQQYSIEPSATRPVATQGERPFELMFICTWASDEPYMNALQAAREFSAETLRMTITGNPKGKVDTSEIPGSVYLAGFMSKTDYVNQLANADGVLVLTTRQDCLNCGAYEAVSMLKPGILSDTSALRNYFSNGFVFTDNSVQNLIQCIRSLISERDSLQKDITGLRIKCERNDHSNRRKVMNFLADLL